MSRIKSFSEVKILILGDIMLDKYIWGDAAKISPEAPIPVFNVRKRSECLGGAGNVAANLIGLGCNVTIIGVCGQDDAGNDLEKNLHLKKIGNRLCRDDSRPTITKTRIIARGQQLIRLDEEKIIPYDEILKDRILSYFEQEVVRHDLVIVSDYGKGMFLTPDLCQIVIKKCRQLNTPVFVDPKNKDWSIYRKATCITPNYAEFKFISNVLNEKDTELKAAVSIRRDYGIDWLLITRGADGILGIDNHDNIFEIPSVAREVFDVSGAGDTVISTLAAGFASGMDFKSAAELANTAAGIVVGKIGTQPINIDELAISPQISPSGASNMDMHRKIMSVESALFTIEAWRSSGDKIVFTNGCFDLLHPGHIHLIRQARILGNKLVVAINSDASVKRLKGDTRPILTQNDRSIILSALSSVDLIVIFEEDTPLNLIKILQPDILVKGSDYTPDTIVGRDIVESYGGKVCIVPLLEDYSTTGITEKMAH